MEDLFDGFLRFVFFLIGEIFRYFGTGILWIFYLGRYPFKELLKAWYAIPLGVVSAFILTIVCVLVYG